MTSPNAQDRQPCDDPGWFATTHWTVVRTAARGENSDSDAALEKLCRVYWPPAFVYVRSRGYGVEDAQDLTQAFFARLLDQDFLSRVSQEKGKFRSFLLKSLNNYLINEWERAKSLKRGGGRSIVSWEDLSDGDWGDLAPGAGLSPELIYQKRWALTLFDQALATLRTEFAVSSKPELFDRLKAFLADEPRDGEYDAVAGELGMTKGALAVAVHRLRQRYRELLRREVAQTVEDPGEIDEEVRYLIGLLGA